ncbi:MAG: T9SS type A sorting domain-containing protein [Chitinophagaceae bacterium]
MKRFLHIISFVLVAAAAKAQTNACAVTTMQVQIKSTTSVAGGCEVLMDVSFTGTFNNGAKYGVIHLWESDPVNHYPNINYTVSTPPGGTVLQNALGTIVIENPGTTGYSLVAAYPWTGSGQPAVKMVSSGVTLTRTGTGPFQYTLQNVKLLLSTCGQPVTVRGDVWGTNNGNNTQCSNQGAITILFNNLQINGIKQCIQPRLLNLSFNNTDDIAINASVKAFIDDGDGVAELGGDDIEITGVLSPALPGTLTIGAGATQNYFNISYAPYSNQPIYDKPVWIQATASAPNAASVTTIRKIDFLGSCALLPVQFKSFSARRISNGQVQLDWVTATELNNTGFAVERKLGNGAWEAVGFINTKAHDGNSQTELSYQFFDVNSQKSMAQYRLRQVDRDGSSRYSDIKAVRGTEQTIKTVIYPNPSNTGQVTVVFESHERLRDVVLYDMNGRVVKSWKNVANNNLSIENLLPGMYNLRITSVDTGDQTSEKIVVSK